MRIGTNFSTGINSGAADMIKEEAPKVIVGLPAYNEDKTISGVILQAKEYSDLVIVANDGSTDHTARVSRLAGALVIDHEHNKGYGVAIQTLLSEAKKQNADILVILDADSQHDPNEIPTLIRSINEGFDLVIGSRETSRNSIPLYRRMGQKVLAKLTNIAARQKVWDTESGFRAYSKKTLSVLELKEKGMAISAEIVSEASLKGLAITEVPISVRYTKDSSTLNPVVHGLGNLNRILVMISERRPMLFFGTAGAVMIILGVITGIGVVQSYYISRILATGSAVLCMLLITLGVLCLFAGVILNVIVKRLE